ncbi:hypothetical protein BT67DRAFT_86142 [Trichocladium antarcticum]|uniref:Uncharacterized protein n=1 Tax=Trichocladium antarcticum TaxID=1450529 RepID=A0AAN6UGR9_9PEZI|nr:hypothetical protein BT67DRAFT_86142 [Trichocladium antarcticum]
MSQDNGGSNTNPNDMARQHRRGSLSSGAFSTLFRNNSVAQAPATAFPTPMASATMNEQRRRLSVTTMGLSGTSPTTPSALLRRASLSTNSDSIDENAIDDEESGPRAVPVSPFTRRMSLGAAQAMRGARGSISPGTNGTQQSLPTAGLGNYTWGKATSQASTATQPRTGPDLCPPSARSDQGFNWSEQLRSRAESTVTAGSRPSFSFASGLSASPPRGAPPAPSTSPRHDRARSVSDMPAPPAQPPRQRAPQKPDHFQERILKGDFYMD